MTRYGAKYGSEYAYCLSCVLPGAGVSWATIWQLDLTLATCNDSLRRTCPSDDVRRRRGEGARLTDEVDMATRVIAPRLTDQRRPLSRRHRFTRVLLYWYLERDVWVRHCSRGWGVLDRQHAGYFLQYPLWSLSLTYMLLRFVRVLELLAKFIF